MIAELGEKDSDGIITLEQLAEYLHVSMATVRRDVDELASRGVLQKTRGGVICRRAKPPRWTRHTPCGSR